MDPLSIIGAVAACSDIVKIIVRITSNLSQVRSRWAEGGRPVQLLAQKLSTIRAALTEIETWAEFSLRSNPRGESLSQWFKIAIDGCQAVMQALDQDILALVGDSVGSRLRQFFLDTNSSLKEHDARLQSQISALQLLLTAAYCQNLSEQNDLLRKHKSTQLLQRVQEDITTIREQSTVRETASEQHNPHPQDDVQNIEIPSHEGISDQIPLISNLPVLNYPTEEWQRPLPFQRPEYADSSIPSEKTSQTLSIFSKRPRSASTGTSDGSGGQHTSWLVRRLSRTARPKSAGRISREQLLSPISRRRIKAPGDLAPTEIYLQSHNNTPPPRTIVAAQRGDVAEMTSLIRRRANVEQIHPKTGRTPLAVAAHCGHEGVVELLLAEGCNLGTKDRSQLEPLHLAAANGHCQVIDILLDREADVNVRGPEDKTPLRVACDHGQMNAIKTLVRRQALVDARDRKKRTSLHMVSDSGDNDVVRLLLQSGANKDAKDSQMRSPLHCACAAGRLDVVRTLLEAKANIEAQDDAKMTPLGIASKLGLRSVAEILIQNKALTNIKSQGDMTPLHWASFQGHDEVVELLLKQKRAETEARNENNRTALHLAAMTRSFGVIEKLLRAGANMEAECSQKYRPLHYACKDVEYSEASLLLNFGADFNAKTSTGETPLHLATKAGSKATVCKLIERGASVDCQDGQGTRPLLTACSQGSMMIVQKLLDSGARLNVPLGPGLRSDSPVCRAASGGFVPIIQELINRGASAREIDSGGWQPLRHAAFMGHVSAVGCLLGNGARANDLGPLEILSFASTATLDQMTRILEILETGLGSEQAEHQRVAYLEASATPANPGDPLELHSNPSSTPELVRNGSYMGYRRLFDEESEGVAHRTVSLANNVPTQHRYRETRPPDGVLQSDSDYSSSYRPENIPRSLSELP
ncbi:ankyrin repeat protein [Metarhizium guizhouense ARSEF 977]|uniref:Ankyrin repeat protein n=1 Tax=Metarhizium guizhouense (strain ARSEF 977) TaxID=1276136 RepID=A0A0B4HML0_METGA|nr:ankyrin repeat protein [Metarhizium guizhouense ARSEF 977]